MTSRRVAVITRPGLGAGFGLAGVSVVEAADGKSAATLIMGLDAESELGVVIVDDTLYSDFPEDFHRLMRRKPLPVLVPVPGPNWEEESTAREYIVEILRRAIGYRVRLR